MVQPRPALVHVTGDRRLRRGRLEQLEVRFADRDEMRAHRLAGDLLRRLDLEAEGIPVERQRGAQIFHRDADVIEDRSHESGVS
jgi:hypothetical protein